MYEISSLFRFQSKDMSLFKWPWPAMTTCAQVHVAAHLLFSDSQAAPPAALGRWVIALASPEFDPSSARERAISPGPPLAPATVNIATGDGFTLQNPGFARAERKWERNVIQYYYVERLHFIKNLNVVELFACTVPVSAVTDDAVSWICKLPIKSTWPYP